MYLRFLNNQDYLGLMTQEAFDQTTRNQNVNEILEKIEPLAESLIKDYLTVHYEIDEELNVGKLIAGYSPDINITFPSGTHIYIDGYIYKTLTPLRGLKRPLNCDYWDEVSENDIPEYILKQIYRYSQMETYVIGSLVTVGEKIYRCSKPNGFELCDIRIPNSEGWSIVDTKGEWRFDDYIIGDIVERNIDDKTEYFRLINDDDSKTTPPEQNNNWELIDGYSEDVEYNIGDIAVYNRSETERVPVMTITNVNQDQIEINKNVVQDDPRNQTILKHFLRIAVYELSKRNSPNNNSVIRIKDYEDTMVWLNRAGSLKITPDIKRKKNEHNEDTVEWAVADINSRNRKNNNGIIKTGWGSW